MSTESNDIVFQKFAAKVLLKVIERQDQREAKYAKLQADLDEANKRYSQLIHAGGYSNTQITNFSNSQATALQQAQASHAQSLLNATIGKFQAAQSMPLFGPATTADITDDELDVVRAYRDGENVLEVLLRQERL